MKKENKEILKLIKSCLKRTEKVFDADFSSVLLSFNTKNDKVIPYSIYNKEILKFLINENFNKDREPWKMAELYMSLENFHIQLEHLLNCYWDKEHDKNYVISDKNERIKRLEVIMQEFFIKLETLFTDDETYESLIKDVEEIKNKNKDNGSTK